MAQAAPFLLAAGSVIKGGTAIMQGISAKREEKAQRGQIIMQTEAARTQAALEQRDRSRKLLEALSAQNAVFGARGVTSTSGSAMRLSQVDAGKYNEATRLAQLNLSTYQDTQERRMDASRIRGTSAMVGGLLKGVSEIAMGAANAYGAAGSMGGAGAPTPTAKPTPPPRP